MSEKRVEFSIRFETQFRSTVLRFGKGAEFGDKIIFSGNVPFSREDYGVRQLECCVDIRRGDSQIETASQQNYLMIAGRPASSFWENHQTSNSIGRLLVREKLRPKTSEEYGVLGLPMEALLLLPPDDWQSIWNAMSAANYNGTKKVQFDFTCVSGLNVDSEVFHDPARLILEKDEEYPIIGCEAAFV